MLVRLLTIMLMACFAVACGQPASQVQTIPTAEHAASPLQGAIAGFLRNSVQPDSSVEFDTYTWRGWSFGEGSSAVARDPQGCPVRTESTVLLVDQPTPWVIPVLGGRASNASNRFPPDEAAWLVVSNPIDVPYHARIRGHFGNDDTAHCPLARHIFTVDQVVATYAAMPPELTETPQPPADYASWPEYHDPALGYRLRYPAGWAAEPAKQPGTVATLAIRSPHHAEFPILVRVYTGETHYDQYDVAHTPLLLQQVGGGPFTSDSLPFAEQVKHQALSGYYRDFGGADRDAQQIGIVVSNYGRSYELFLRYPLGMDAAPDLTAAYTFVVLSFAFDMPPAPTPTPPIRQVLGKGPFLSTDQLLVQLRRNHGAEAKLLDSQLVSEAAARQLHKGCSTFQGHYDGIWLVTLYGMSDGMWGTLRGVYDATTGNELCGEFAADPSRPTATPFVPTSTPRSDPSPYPAPYPMP